jgi:putative flavoprotein involved in K+ transport
MSRCLSDRSIEHVVLERGRVAERWRSERWDSLRLLTPNWQSRLPGFRYQGADPDGYMTMPEVIEQFERYARASQAPVETGTSVRRVRRAAPGYQIETNRGSWRARNVVVATGYCDTPFVPPTGQHVSRAIHQLVPGRYRNAAQLPPGGVLVVGASASGLQLADELRRAGRPVTLAVGRHIRLPRLYRGRDIMWWLDAMGVLHEPASAVADIRVSRKQPSLGLVGHPDHRSLDVGTLLQRGVRLVGHAVGADGTTITFEDDLVASVAAADAKLAGLLARIDAFIESDAVEGPVPAGEPFVPCWPRLVPSATRLDLRAEGITSILWATGFRRLYPWLQVPVLDRRCEIQHRSGVTPSPGLYVLGLQFQRRRNSAFIDGVGDDAAYLAEQIAHAVDIRIGAVA